MATQTKKMQIFCDDRSSARQESARLRGELSRGETPTLSVPHPTIPDKWVDMPIIAVKGVVENAGDTYVDSTSVCGHHCPWYVAVMVRTA